MNTGMSEAQERTLLGPAGQKLWLVFSKGRERPDPIQAGMGSIMRWGSCRAGVGAA